MPSKSNVRQEPRIFLTTGKAALALRRKLGFNQSEFWNRIKVTQSGGSRYESGHNLPLQTQLLLHFAYAPTAEAIGMLNHLRIEDKIEKQ